MDVGIRGCNLIPTAFINNPDRIPEHRQIYVLGLVKMVTTDLSDNSPIVQGLSCNVETPGHQGVLCVQRSRIEKRLLLTLSPTETCWSTIGGERQDSHDFSPST